MKISRKQIKSYFLWGVLYLLLVGPVIAICFIDNPDDAKRLARLYEAAAGVPVYPGFTICGSTGIAKQNVATVSFYFKSSAPFEEVKRYYVQVLQSKGWSSPEELISSSDFTSPSRELRFRKEGYTIILYYMSENEDWDYSLAYNWRR